ncbi:MAG: IS4 family transposase [Saprospiraceae bacterium]|nr:IS4 family transposase [Saprospiraceae bacterium]
MIHRISSDEAEQRSYYRLLHNANLETAHVQDYLYADCRRQVVSGAHYLCIQDTTQPNFERKRKHISNQAGLGVIGDGRSLGFFLHPSLVVGADDGRVLGFSNIQTWSRAALPPMTEAEKKQLRVQKKARPICEKESYRWQTAAIQSKEVLREAGQMTVVCDREGDIGDLFLTVPDERTHVLVRSSTNRKVRVSSENGQCQDTLLFEHLSAQALVGKYKLKIKGDIRQKRVGRVAEMSVRISRVALPLGDQIVHLYAVEAKEEESTVPPGEEAVHWRVLTTHVVESLEQATTILDWYAMRWNIEQLFRLIKRKGLNVEDSDMETGKALIQLTLLSLYAAAKILLLHLASKEEVPQPIQQTFTPEEIECLTAVGTKCEGKTLKQKNPYPPSSLQWCYWIIARLGGWKPHEKQAGVITLFRGWSDFQKIFDGWCLAKNFVS